MLPEELFGYLILSQYCEWRQNVQIRALNLSV